MDNEQQDTLGAIVAELIRYNHLVTCNHRLTTLDNQVYAERALLRIAELVDADPSRELGPYAVEDMTRRQLRPPLRVGDLGLPDDVDADARRRLQRELSDVHAVSAKWDATSGCVVVMQERGGVRTRVRIDCYG